MILDILLTVFLVFLNGFFVAAEFSLVKVRASQMEVKAAKGNRLAAISQKIIAKLDSYLSACQVGITIASLALGWIGESVVARMMHAVLHSMGYNLETSDAHRLAVPVAFTLITVLHIVFGEQAPKIVAIKHPLPTTMAVAVPLRIFYFVFRPFIWFVNEFSNLLLRIVGINARQMGEIHSEEELRMLLTESEEGGAIKPSEHELIQNVFEFDDRVVKQILIPRTKISAIDVESTNEQLIQRVIEEGYTRMPVYQESLDNIVGVIYTKDLLRILHSKQLKPMTEIMRPAYFVPLNKRINELLKEFQTQHIQIAIVTNEFGGTAGIVTMEDIIEEIVGEIQDEYDDEKPAVEKKSETEFIVNAMANISDVNDVLPIALPESANYDTVSGLLNYIYGRIPAVNEKRVFGGYEFTILKRFRHSVDSVKMVVVDTDSVNEEED
jgi:CBS domain containing-hemolysin-like protein